MTLNAGTIVPAILPFEPVVGIAAVATVATALGVLGMVYLALGPSGSTVDTESAEPVAGEVTESD